MAVPGTSALFSQESLRRGSIWRKWDLHIHSPNSVFNNQFPAANDGSPDWDVYIEALQKLQDTKVLGKLQTISQSMDTKKSANRSTLENLRTLT